MGSVVATLRACPLCLRWASGTALGNTHHLQVMTASSSVAAWIGRLAPAPNQFGL